MQNYRVQFNLIPRTQFNVIPKGVGERWGGGGGSISSVNLGNINNK